MTQRLRQAGRGDLALIETLLRGRIETSMFPLGNLVANGLAEGPGAAPRSMRFWLQGDPPDGVLGLSLEGVAMPQLAGGFELAAQAIAGEEIGGILGESGQVRALLAATGLADCPMRMDHDEPQFALELEDLILPDCAGFELVPAGTVARDLLMDWRAAYEIEVLEATPDEAPARAEAVVPGWIKTDSHRVLLQGGQPVALTGFNARLPDIVQIGGVWTPPALRGRGLARRAVALHLAEASQRGVTRATLCAANDSAARAYQAIGFRPLGRFTMLFFETPQEVALV